MNSQPDKVNTGARQLEDAFFLDADKRIIENLRKLREMKETKEALAAVSGITNDAVLTRLIELDVRPETLASLAVVPMVEVAWADGTLDDREKQALLKVVQDQGVVPGGIEYDLLHQWMEHKPPKSMLEAWSHYIQGLCEVLSKEQCESLKTSLLGHLRAIALSSGGVLNLGIGNRISKEEEGMIARLENAFTGK